MRACVIALLIGCSAPPPPVEKPAVAPQSKRDLAVAEPAPKQPVPPERGTDPNDPSWQHEWVVRAQDRPPDVVMRRRVPPPMQTPQELDVGESDMWSPCVRDFVRARPEPARRALSAAFARFDVRCDANKRVVLEPPTDVVGRSFVAYRGMLTPRVDVRVQIATCGNPTSIDSVSFLYDGKKWTSASASERRDNCTLVDVPDTPLLRRTLREVLDAKDAMVTFGGLTADDLPFTDDMKRDLRVMLDALDALTAP